MGGPPGRAGAEGAGGGSAALPAGPPGRRRGSCGSGFEGAPPEPAAGRRERRWPAFRSLRPGPRCFPDGGPFPKAPLSRGGAAGTDGRTDGRGRGAPAGSPRPGAQSRALEALCSAAGALSAAPENRGEGRFVRPEFPSTRRTERRGCDSSGPERPAHQVSVFAGAGAVTPRGCATLPLGARSPRGHRSDAGVGSRAQA